MRALAQATDSALGCRNTVPIDSESLDLEAMMPRPAQMPAVRLAQARALERAAYPTHHRGRV